MIVFVSKAACTNPRFIEQLCFAFTRDNQNNHILPIYLDPWSECQQGPVGEKFRGWLVIDATQAGEEDTLSRISRVVLPPAESLRARRTLLLPVTLIVGAGAVAGAAAVVGGTGLAATVALGAGAVVAAGAAAAGAVKAGANLIERISDRRAARARKKREELLNPILTTGCNGSPMMLAELFDENLVQSDNVTFSLSSSKTLERGSTSEVNVWAHLAAQREEMLERAKEQHGSDDLAVKSKGPVPMERGTVLTVELRVPGTVVNPAEETMVWTGEVGNACFTVTVPAEHEEGTIPSEAILRVEGLAVARIAFVLNIGRKKKDEEALCALGTQIRTAFASYASEDRDQVLARIQGMQKVLPGLDVFVDVASLRSNEGWKNRLHDEILKRDVLYLFWSKAASESEWVDREWRCAYGEKGDKGIDPVPMVSPEEVKPPQELSEKHFNDWVLAYMRGRPSSSDQTELPRSK